MGRIKKLAEDTLPAIAAVVDPRLSVIVVIIISSLSGENDYSNANNGMPYKLEKTVLLKKSLEIFGTDNLTKERRDLIFDKICDKLNGWNFDVKRYLLEHHYLDKYAQDIAKDIDKDDERIILYTKRVLEIIVKECREKTDYYEALESVLRNNSHLLSEDSKFTKKQTLSLDDYLCRYREKLDDIIERDESYLYLPKNSNIPFVSDELLFSEYDQFIRYDCFGTFLNKVVTPLFDKLEENDRKNLGFYQKKKKEVATLLRSSKKFNVILKELNKIQQELIEKNKRKTNEIKRGFEKLDKDSLENCFSISGYYGTGKTTLSYELAKNNLDVFHIFLSLKEGLEKQLQDTLNYIFKTNERPKKILDDYKNMQFVIVLDNLQLGFFPNYDISKVFAFIEEYTQKNVKFLLLIQTDFRNWFQNKVKEYQKNREPVFNPWRWTDKLHDCDLYGWLKLDQRYKHIEVMEQILREKKAGLPTWINEVGLRSYYTPLFIRIALSYKKLDELFHKDDISYPEFCEYYYGILTNQNEQVMRLVDQISIVCSNKKLIEIIIPDDLNDQIKDPESLIQYGLLESQDKEEKRHAHKKHLYFGVPDIVWFYRIAEYELKKVGSSTLEIERIYNQVIDPKEEQKEKMENFIMNICSMMVLFIEEKIINDKDKENCIKCIKDILMSRYYLAVNDILKKSVSAIRNNIISWLIPNDEGSEAYLLTTSLLEICEDGNVDFCVLQKLIKFICNNKKNLISDEISLFFNILYTNMEFYGCQECIKILKLLNGFDELEQVDSKREGMVFAKKIYQKCNNHKDLVNESIKIFLALGSKHYWSFPKSIIDYYIEYIFDYYIAENGFGGFEYLIMKHYFKKTSRLTDGEQNVHKAIVMSGSYFYKNIYKMKYEIIDSEFKCRWVPEEYKVKYEDMIKKYSQSTAIWKRRLAMYLIVHIGLKHNDYKVDLSYELRQIFHDLFRSDDMQAYMDDSVNLFYKRNFLCDKEKIPQSINE